MSDRELAIIDIAKSIVLELVKRQEPDKDLLENYAAGAVRLAKLVVDKSIAAA